MKNKERKNNKISIEEVARMNEKELKNIMYNILNSTNDDYSEKAESNQYILDGTQVEFDDWGDEYNVDDNSILFNKSCFGCKVELIRVQLNDILDEITDFCKE